MRAAVLIASIALAAAVLLAFGRIGEGNGGPAVTRGGAADACSRYAAPWGRDSARGTFSRPVRTAQRLVETLRRGETGCLRGGTYTATDGPYVLDVRRGGIAGARVTVRSAPRERAKLVGIVTVTSGANHVILSRLTIEGTGRQNAVKVYAADFVLQDSMITTGGRDHSCVYLGEGAVRTVIRRNRFRDCGEIGSNKDHAIYAAEAVDGVIADNVFWSHAGRAIQLFPNAQRNLVTRNVIDGGAPSIRGGIVVGGDGGTVSNRNVIERNVIAFAETYNVYSNWDDGVPGEGNVVRFNCVWGAKLGNINTEDGGFEAYENMVAPPMFANRARRDYRLRPASACHEALSATPGE